MLSLSAFFVFERKRRVMGTYINFKQPYPLLINGTDSFLKSASTIKGGPILTLWTQEDINVEKEKVKSTGHGSPDFYEIGEGSIKISGGDYLDEIYRPNNILGVLSEAARHYGLMINLPGNADDYLTEDEISMFIPINRFRTKQRKALEDYEGERKARDIALEKKRKKLKGGLYLCDSWGAKKSIWAVFGNVDKPAYLQFDYEYKGKSYKDLYRDKEGRAYLLIPLMKLTGDSSGYDEVLESLVYAWEHLGLRTHPDVIMVACYKALPKSILIPRINDTEYYPETLIQAHFSNDTPVLFFDQKDEIAVRSFSLENPHKDLSLKLKSKSNKHSVIYTNSHDLARVLEINFMNDN